MATDPGKRHHEAIAVFSFGVSLIGSIGLGVTYWFGGNTQLEGVFAAAAFGGIGVGLIVWSRHLLPQGDSVEEIQPFEPSDDLAEVIHEGTEQVTRRRFLARLLGAAAVALGAVALFPLRSLGPRPASVPYSTRWRAGSRLVTQDGSPVRAAEVVVGTVLTVFPEGHTDDVSGQTLLIRVDPLDLRASPGREAAAAGGLIAYSKLCTHAGCPVGLYEPDLQQLFCPCHQSLFDVLDGARPLAGPAPRPLPQLPIRVDDAGFVVAQDTYQEPVGPSFWERG